MNPVFWSKVWHDTGDFVATHAAEDFLEHAGFSVGRTQRGERRGILFGDYDIQKWRNLNEAERQELHGVMTPGEDGSYRGPGITVVIWSSAPAEAKNALHIHESEPRE